MYADHGARLDVVDDLTAAEHIRAFFVVLYAVKIVHDVVSSRIYHVESACI